MSIRFDLFSNRTLSRQWNSENQIRLGESQALNLLGMPLVCGDTIANETESIQEVEALLVRNIESAPMMSAYHSQ